MLWKGLQYERLALSYLRKNKLKLLEKNFHSKYGEIDLIMEDDQHLVFVEVRYRQSPSHGSALESVTSRKQIKIVKSANYYLLKTNAFDRNCRFDVIAISPQASNLKLPKIEWIQSAFY